MSKIVVTNPVVCGFMCMKFFYNRHTLDYFWGIDFLTNQTVIGIQNLDGEETISISKEDMKYVVEKKLILVGGGASGKDFLKKMLKDYGMSCDVSYTTREPRDGEVDGEAYNFVTIDRFEDMIVAGNFVQWNKFENGHYYGTSTTNLKTDNVFIMSPNVIGTLSRQIRDKFFVVYLDIPENIRRSRLIERPNFNETKANERIVIDKKEFDEFDDYDMVITDPEFSI